MAEVPTPALEIDSVTVAFGELRAVDRVSLVVRPGEIVGLIGPNGSGKTTLVNVVTGFQAPTGGRVRLAGRDITAVRPEGRAAAGLARTFQAVRLFPRMTVAENVEVAALAVGASRRSARDVAAELVVGLGLAPVAHVRAAVLPYGLERRVALARAMAARPKYLLLDEPAAGLDEEETDDLAAVLRDIRDTSGCGMLVIEHDMRLITTICDRVHVLVAGRTLTQGLPGEVVTDLEVIEAYLGASPVATSPAAPGAEADDVPA